MQGLIIGKPLLLRGSISKYLSVCCYAFLLFPLSHMPVPPPVGLPNSAAPSAVEGTEGQECIRDQLVVCPTAGLCHHRFCSLLHHQQQPPTTSPSSMNNQLTNHCIFICSTSVCLLHRAWAETVHVDPEFGHELPHPTLQ